MADHSDSHVDEVVPVIAAETESAPEIPLFNRELSWLAFNRRVMWMAEEPRLPLLERLKFLSIWSRNLDEFFQVRVANLKAAAQAELAEGAGRSVDGLTTTAQLVLVRDEVEEQYRRIAKIYKATKRELDAEGISIFKWSKLTPEEQKHLSEEFVEQVLPVLTPLAVDPGHPFPYISSLSLSVGVRLAEPSTGREHFARIKVPTDRIGRHMRTPERVGLVPVEQVIGANLDRLFPGMEILEWASFRLTRDADQPIDDRDADDLLRAVETQLEQRRFGDVVRVELYHKTSPTIRSLLIDRLGVGDDDVFYVKGLIDLGSGAGFEVTDRPELRLERWEPSVPDWLRADGQPADLFALLRKRDVLVHHPYVSFEASVLELIRQAVADPGVQAIKLTLYRTAGDGRIVDLLIEAAASGKQVAVVVELKARFDELNNIAWARRLERAGVHVTYGLVGLKVHAKALLIVRSEQGKLQRYAHIGTGNYNSKTAKAYTDLGLFTSDRQVADDLGLLFNSLTGFSVSPVYERLVVAPRHLRSRLTELIRGEALHGPDGTITAKMNSLLDRDLIGELYAASQAGVQISLIVRGMCALMPGVPGLSENITVRSILGRHLEHSRVYRFGHGGADDAPVYLMGSADLMPRNLDRRVEVLTPLLDRTLQQEIDIMFEINSAADHFTWELDAEGAWNRVPIQGDCNPQLQFQRREQSRAHNEVNEQV